MNLEEMRRLTPFITGGGDVFRAQVVGYHRQAGPVSRAEVVVDATAAWPRLRVWRDLSHLGRGYDREMLVIPQND